jgi:hypothetical protein
LSVALILMFFSLTFSQIISGQSLVLSTTRRLPVVRITSLTTYQSINQPSD